MVDVSNKHKSITVGVSSNNGNTIVTAKSDTSQYWANQAHTFSDQAKESVQEAKNYAELANSYIEGFEDVVTSNTNNIITTSNDCINQIAENTASAIDSIASTKTTVLNDIEFVADGEKKEINELADVIKDNADSIINRVGLNMFDTVVKDYILTYEESKGLALQGTWVYKTAIVGERYGYRDFYNKVVEEFNEATETETVNGVTVKVHSNGHKFYDIANKTVIDEFFNTMGTAWFYGVDIENECIFLPRNNYFEQATGDVSEVGLSIEAGLPNITGDASLNIKRNASGSSGAVSIENVTGCVTTGATSQMPYYTSGGTTSNAHPYVLGIDASLSNPIYGNSDTIQPNAVKKLLYICVGNTVSDTSWVDVVTQVKGGVKDLEDKKNASIAEIDANAKSYDNLTKRQITNCLLEVPQNIKLELNDGTLTLKAGSKVIVPNGVEVFDEVVISADIPRTWTFNGQGMMFYRYDTNVLHPVPLSQIHSGTTAPTGTLPAPTCWYDTTNNKVKITSDGGTTWIDTFSLPLCLLTANGTEITSINQIFNGMGYIGSTIWVDKGVKALLANGRNEDNSLKSLEITTSKINTITEGSTANASTYVLLSETGTLFMRTNNPTRYYDGKLNYFITDGKPATCCVCATQIHDNTSKILSLDVKTPFRVADYNDLPFTGVCESRATTAGGATKKSPAVIVRNYRAGSTWYRVWSDGWIEQGGIVNIPAYTTSTTKELTVLEEFSDTNYSVFTQMSSGSTGWANVSTNVEGKTTSGFDIRCYQASGTGASIKAHNITWYACGY